MTGRLYEKIVFGFTTAVVVGFALQGYYLYPEHEKDRTQSSDVYTATTASESYTADTEFIRTCTSTTICASIKKLENGFKEVCELSSNPKNDLLLEWIKRERDSQFFNDGSYFVCEDWNCKEVKFCSEDQCYYFGNTAQISLFFPCEPAFTYEMWGKKREWERIQREQ